jgi:hypothetical protein
VKTVRRGWAGEKSDFFNTLLGMEQACHGSPAYDSIPHRESSIVQMKERYRGICM